MTSLGPAANRQCSPGCNATADMSRVRRTSPGLGRSSAIRPGSPPTGPPDRRSNARSGTSCVAATAAGGPASEAGRGLAPTSPSSPPRSTWPVSPCSGSSGAARPGPSRRARARPERPDLGGPGHLSGRGPTDPGTFERAGPSGWPSFLCRTNCLCLAGRSITGQPRPVGLGDDRQPPRVADPIPPPWRRDRPPTRPGWSSPPSRPNPAACHG